MLIGVTGQIGSGKSTAARIFKTMGAAVIDADKIGKEVVESSPGLLQKLTRQFGKDILNKSGKLNRRKLARRAFQNEETKQKLNDLVHPYLLKELHRQMKQNTRTHQVVVIDAALLLYWNIDKEMDLVIVIHAGLELRIRRLAKRGIKCHDALARQKAQLPYRDFKKRADYLILNNSTESALRNKILRILNQIKPKAVDI